MATDTEAAEKSAEAQQPRSGSLMNGHTSPLVNDHANPNAHIASLDGLPFSNELASQVRTSLLPVLLDKIRVDHFPAGEPIPLSAIEKAKSMFTEEACMNFVRIARSAREAWLQSRFPLPAPHTARALSPPLKRPRNDDPSYEPHKRQRTAGHNETSQSHARKSGDTTLDSTAKSVAVSPSRSTSLDARQSQPSVQPPDTNAIVLGTFSSATSLETTPFPPVRDCANADGIDQPRPPEIQTRSSFQPVAAIPVSIHDPTVDHPTLPLVNENTAPTSADKVSTTSGEHTQPDHALPPLAETFNIPGVWGIASGGKYSRTHTYTFYLQEDVFRAIEGWRKRYHHYDSTERHVILRLLCVPHGPLLAFTDGDLTSAPSREDVAMRVLDMPTRWPDGTGMLVLQVNDGQTGAGPWYSHQFPSGAGFELLDGLRPGRNELKILQIGDLADRALVLLATGPTERDLDLLRTWKEQEPLSVHLTDAQLPGSFVFPLAKAAS